MKHRIAVIFLGGGVVSAFSGCMMDADSDVDEAARSVQQALLTPTFTTTWLTNFTSAAATVTCPQGLPWALGAGAFGDLNAVYYAGGIVPTQVKVQSVTNQDTAVVVCSDAFATYITQFDTDGSTIVECPDWKVPVGGGAICSNSSARLVRSRPNPDTNGSTPTGWYASCDTGAITAYVNCADKAANYDFTTCRTRRVDNALQDHVTVPCQAGELAVAVGGYCGGNADLEILNLAEDLEEVYIQCADESVYGYAICCDANLD